MPSQSNVTDRREGNVAKSERRTEFTRVMPSQSNVTDHFPSPPHLFNFKLRLSTSKKCIIQNNLLPLPKYLYYLTITQLSQ